MRRAATTTIPPAAVAAWVILQGLILAMSAWGWRWSHAWPTTPGAGALPAMAVAQVVCSALLGRALVRDARGLLLACGTAATFQLAAVAIQPSPLPVVPPVLGWMTAWLAGLWVLHAGLGRRWGGIAGFALVGAIAWEAIAVWILAAGSGGGGEGAKWVEVGSRLGPLGGVVALSQPGSGWWPPTSPHLEGFGALLAWFVPAALLACGPIAVTLRRGNRVRSVSTGNPHPVH